MVGNDVVDLGAPRARGMSSRARFVDRVFTAAERERIAVGPEPDLEVWLGWAAKEAAYKVVSKLLGEAPIFVHRAFVVRWEPEARARAGEATDPSTGSVGPSRIGVVHYEDVALPVRAAAAVERGYVHALSWQGGGDDAATSPVPRGTIRAVERLDRSGAPWSGSLQALESRLTDREREPVHSLLSAAVRIGARGDACKLLGVDPHRLEIVCRPGRTGRRPPVVLVDGAPASVDVSLSHDGPWIAWALAPAEAPVPTSDLGTGKP